MIPTLCMSPSNARVLIRKVEMKCPDTCLCIAIALLLLLLIINPPPPKKKTKCFCVCNFLAPTVPSTLRCTMQLLTDPPRPPSQALGPFQGLNSSRFWS